MKSKFVVILAAFFAVAVVSVAFAGRGEMAGRGGGRGHGGFFEQLTEEQRAALHAKVEEMRAAGASREEIHAAVRDMLAGWGIEMPEHPAPGDRGGREGSGEWGRRCGPEGERAHHPRFLDQLTEEQREVLRDKVEEMRAAGASHEEIRAAVHEMLSGWGIEVPEAPRGREHRWGEIIKQLTDEQRQAIRVKALEMKEAGATREEIRAAIREMLEGFGIVMPDGAEGDAGMETLEGGNTKSARWGEIKASYK